MFGSAETGFGKMVDTTGMRVAGNAGMKVLPGTMASGKQLHTVTNGFRGIGANPRFSLNYLIRLYYFNRLIDIRLRIIYFQKIIARGQL